MEHWFDELTKKVASPGLSRRDMIGTMFAAGLGTLGARFPSDGFCTPMAWFDAILRMVQTHDPSACQVTRSGAARILSLTIDDNLGAAGTALRSTVTFTPGVTTPQSDGWTVTAGASIVQGAQAILKLTTSTGARDNGHMEIDFGKGYQGAKVVSLAVGSDKRTVTGSVDGHAFLPFSAGTVPKLADGTPVPPISVDPVTKAKVAQLITATRAAQQQCGKPRPQVSNACDDCGLACGEKFTECLATVAEGAFWELPSCYSDLNDCYAACNSPGHACCSASCEVDGGCCVDGAQCCGNGSTAHCCAPGQACCNGICCPVGLVCHNPGQAIGVCCHPNDLTCSATLCCPAGGQCCGDFCCNPGTQCADPKTGFCCPINYVSCGADACCGPQATSVCLDTVCCKKSDVCGSKCCPGGPCINNTCCPSPNHVCGSTCCPGFNACCGTQCCGDTTDVCLLGDRNTPLGCCPASQACANFSGNAVCCPTGQICVDNRAGTCAPCPAGQVTCGVPPFNTPVCCPEGVNCCNNKCCKPNEICCTPVNTVTGPYGCYPATYCVN